MITNSVYALYMLDNYAHNTSMYIYLHAHIGIIFIILRYFKPFAFEKDYRLYILLYYGFITLVFTTTFYFGVLTIRITVFCTSRSRSNKFGITILLSEFENI